MPISSRRWTWTLFTITRSYTCLTSENVLYTIGRWLATVSIVCSCRVQNLVVPDFFGFIRLAFPRACTFHSPSWKWHSVVHCEYNSSSATSIASLSVFVKSFDRTNSVSTSGGPYIGTSLPVISFDIKSSVSTSGQFSMASQTMFCSSNIRLLTVGVCDTFVFHNNTNHPNMQSSVYINSY